MNSQHFFTVPTSNVRAASASSPIALVGLGPMARCLHAQLDSPYTFEKATMTLEARVTFTNARCGGLALQINPLIAFYIDQMGITNIYALKNQSPKAGTLSADNLLLADYARATYEFAAHIQWLYPEYVVILGMIVSLPRKGPDFGNKPNKLIATANGTVMDISKMQTSGYFKSALAAYWNIQREYPFVNCASSSTAGPYLNWYKRS